MKTYLLITAITGLFALNLEAQPLTATKGIEKIKTNLENAKKNKVEYDKNLELVKANVLEVKKAKDATLNQKKMVYSEIVKNTSALKKMNQQTQLVNNLITKEQEKIAAETKQIEQLQSMINQIKTQQEQRHLIIKDYQQQLSTAEAHKKTWQNREAELRLQETKTIDSLRTLASEEATWTSKKKKYENELKRWSAEAEKQQRIHDTYQALAEGK